MRHRNLDRVRYIEHPGRENRGISASHNVGIRQAKGEFIAFLDADDVWLPEKLEQQTAILDSHPEAMMLYGKTYYWYSWNKQPGDGNRDRLIDSRIEPETLIKPPSLLVKFLKEETPIPCPSDILVRRRGATEVGGFEESFHHIFTDQAFYAKLCLNWPVFVSDANWSKYRKHPDSAVARIKKTGQMRQSRLAYLNWLEAYLDKHDASDRHLRRALKIAKLKCLYPGLHRFRQHLKYRASIANELLRSAARQNFARSGHPPAARAKPQSSASIKLKCRTLFLHRSSFLVSTRLNFLARRSSQAVPSHILPMRSSWSMTDRPTILRA